MNSVPEMAEILAEHPAALEAAAAFRSEAGGVRPQWAALLPVSSRPIRVPSHNARLAGFLAYRQAALAAQGQRVTVAEPQRLAFRSLLGVRRIPYGFALNLEFAYRSPSGSVYVLTGYCTGYEDGVLTGEGRARGCTCPDFQKRRGPSRDQLRGEERCCKHMRLLLAVFQSWQGQEPWIGGVSRFFQQSGESFKLLEF